MFARKDSFPPFTKSFRNKMSAVLFCLSKILADKNFTNLPFLCAEEIYNVIAKDRFIDLFSGFDSKKRSATQMGIFEKEQSKTVRISVKVEKFLDEMTKLGNVIAGGSIVYALCDHIEKNKVGDIDIFVSDSKHITATIHHIESIFGKNNWKYYLRRYGSHEMSYYENYDEFLRYSKSKSFAEYYVGVNVEYNHLKFQIILKKYTNWKDVVESFDLDYVQCAYINSTFNTTEDCRRAHSARRVSYKYCDDISERRCRKAWAKGFKTPKIITTYNESGIDNNTIEYDENENSVFLPLIGPPSNQSKRKKLMDQNITSFDMGKLQFVTVDCCRTTHINLKFSDLKNIRFFKENFSECSFQFDPISIGGCEFSTIIMYKHNLIKWGNRIIRVKVDHNHFLNLVDTGFYENCWH